MWGLAPSDYSNHEICCHIHRNRDKVEPCCGEPVIQVSQGDCPFRGGCPRPKFGKRRGTSEGLMLDERMAG